MKEVRLLSINWNTRFNTPEDGWHGGQADTLKNKRWENFYIGFGLIGFYWHFMHYDGLPMWSLGLGLFRISYADCHQWVDR